MKIAIIAAMGENRVIGAGGKIPWHLPADFRRFKELTMGHAIIEGRKTYESIGKPLPGRTNIIMTAQKGFAAPGCLVARSFDEALRVAGNQLAVENGDIVFVCGGEQVYKLALPKADVMYLTRVAGTYHGDAFFPEFDEGAWRLAYSEAYPRDTDNPVDFTWVTYERKRRYN